MIVGCKYKYEDLLQILQNTDLKYLVLKFYSDDPVADQPKFKAISYATVNGIIFSPDYYELEEIPGSNLDLTGKPTAILGNNVIDLQILRLNLSRPTPPGGFHEFEYLKFTPAFHAIFTEHIGYTLATVPAIPGVVCKSPDPCPPVCPLH